MEKNPNQLALYGLQYNPEKPAYEYRIGGEVVHSLLKPRWEDEDAPLIEPEPRFVVRKKEGNKFIMGESISAMTERLRQEVSSVVGYCRWLRRRKYNGSRAGWYAS